MGHWMCINEEDREKKDKIYKYPKKLSLMIDLSPMQEDFFYHVIMDIIRNITQEDYLTVAYGGNIRDDKVTCIQVERLRMNQGYHVEIIKRQDKESSFQTYCIVDVPLNKTIKIFRQVLVDFECPDLSEWRCLTDIIKECEPKE